MLCLIKIKLCYWFWKYKIDLSLYLWSVVILVRYNLFCLWDTFVIICIDCSYFIVEFNMVYNLINVMKLLGGK